jgi:hypothetical protein
MKRALLTFALLAACNTLPPEVLPPPFGPLHKEDTHLFFPTGMAVTQTGALVVANGNFNHRYDFGSVVGIHADYVASFFNGGRVGDQPLVGDESAVIIGNYAGPLVLNSAGTMAFTGSRDTGVLNAVAVAPDGTVSCPPGAGPSSTDCRDGILNLKTANVQGTTAGADVDGPWSIVRGDFIPPGSTTPHPVLFVNSVVPHIDTITSGIVTTSGHIAALDDGDPSQVLFSYQTSTSLATQGNGWASGALAFDPVRRRLYTMGCYSRFAGTGAAEPGSAKCNNVATNLLRVIDVDAQAASSVQFYDMYSDVLSIETTSIMLADPDPITGASTTLYASMRNPDTLVQIALPLDYSQAPRVRRAIPMPITPADMLLIPRAGDSDLIAMISERSGALGVYDVGRQTVVAVVEGLGDSPFNVTRVPCPPEAAGSACLAATVFGECKLAFVEVPLAAPWNAVLRGRGGGCL